MRSTRRRPALGPRGREAADLDRGHRGERAVHDLRRAQGADGRVARRRRLGRLGRGPVRHDDHRRDLRGEPRPQGLPPVRSMTMSTDTPWMPVPDRAPASRSTDCRKTFTARRRPERRRPAGHRTCTPTRARSSRCSGRRAAASRRSCASSPTSRSRPPGEVLVDGKTPARAAHAAASSASPSRTTRCCRGAASARTSSCRSRSPGRRPTRPTSRS